MSGRAVQFPWFVFVLAVFPTLFTFVHNYGEVVVRAMYVPLLVGIGAAGAFLVLLYPVRRDWRPAGVATAILLGWFVSFQIQWMAIQQLPVFPSKLQAIPLTGVPALLLAGLVLWRPKLSHPLVRPLNVFAFILLALSGAQLVAAVVLGPDAGDVPPAEWRPVAAAPPQGEAAGAGDPAPDIYYVILDGYARADVLRDVYGYDNSRFLRRLEEEGFHVIEDARANYDMTFLSLASSLNGQYLDELGRRLRGLPFKPDLGVPYEMIQENVVMEFLKDRGYTIYSLETSWGPTRHVRAADVSMGCVLVTGWEFHRVVLSLTAAYPLRSKIPRVPVDYEVQRCLLDKLLRVPEQPGPKFVFAHILTPHHPAVFGPDGEPAELDPALLGDEKGWANRDGYLGEVTFINSVVLRLVETLRRSGEPQPIIVVQSDHGPASTGWENTHEIVRERVPILQALYLPGVDSVPAQQLITPVNTFRFLLSEYFGVPREMLPNHSYFSPPWDPYEYVRVDTVWAD